MRGEGEAPTPYTYEGAKIGGRKVGGQGRTEDDASTHVRDACALGKQEQKHREQAA